MGIEVTNQTPTSRGFFGYGCDALAGIVSAMILAFALSHPASPLVLFGYIASFPLFIVGLGFGAVSASIAAAAGAAGIFAFGPPGVGAFYLSFYAIPAALMVALALGKGKAADGTPVWASLGNLAVAFAIYPCLIFILIFVQMGAHSGGLLATTVDMLDSMTGQINEMLTANGQTLTPEMSVKLHDYILFLARILPALVMGAWVFATAIVMGVAQAFMQKQGWNLRPSTALIDLRLPRWYIVIAVAGVAAAFAPAPYDYAGLNVAIILGLPLFCIGLAVIHVWAKQTRSPGWFLFAFYSVISTFVRLGLLVMLLGAMDQWVDFRKRIAAKASKITINQGEKK